ncbi:hypothetical protein CBS9595_000894 [Malassezia furfur]|nr:hypothetical protein CBS9595_000894 [Malassezia furfur]
MVASPTPIPEPRHRRSDPLDIPQPSTNGAPLSRSPFSALAQGSLGTSLSPTKYCTPYQATIASQWKSARHNSISKMPPQTPSLSVPTDPNMYAASAPSSRPFGWPSLPRYDVNKLPDTANANASANGTPFTKLYRQLSNSQRRSPPTAMATENAGFSTSFGSSTSESPMTPQSQQGFEYTSARRYAERLEHVDADGMWSQPDTHHVDSCVFKSPENNEEPTLRRSLQRHLSSHSKRRPSPMGERLLMGHLDTQ